MEPHSYEWILVIGLIFAFLDAFGIGANDVANSFATSVGSRSLTLASALVIACFTEFGGAVLLGASTTETVKGKIITITSFNDKPEVLMLGFACALVGSSLFVLTATKIGWPVSTTHSIIGALGGIGVAAFGWSGVQWKPVRDILISWVAAPGISSVFASIIFLFTKFFVLDAKDSLRRGILAIPFYFSVTLGVTTFYLLSKAPKTGLDLKKNPDKTGISMAITFSCAAAYGILCFVFLVPFFKRYLIEEEDLKWYHIFMPWAPTQQKNPEIQKHLGYRFGGVTREDEATEFADMKEASTAILADTEDSFGAKVQEIKKKTFAVLTKGLTMDVATIQGKRNQNIHDNCVKYESKTEYLFSILQVCTAAFASFAHGSNDVANAAGPLAGIVSIFNTAKIPAKNVPVPIWILALMGVAIDLGLLLMGWKIMSVLGNKLTFQSPSRGFSMELGAALTVVTASFLSIPVSTTHCITGATVGVGLCNGNAKAINWRSVAWILAGWVLTVPAAGLFSGSLFKLLLSAPQF